MKRTVATQQNAEKNLATNARRALFVVERRANQFFNARVPGIDRVSDKFGTTFLGIIPFLVAIFEVRFRVRRDVAGKNIGKLLVEYGYFREIGDNILDNADIIDVFRRPNRTARPARLIRSFQTMIDRPKERVAVSFGNPAAKDRGEAFEKELRRFKPLFEFIA